MADVIAFIDTNYFLHYQPPDQIDWPTFLEAGSVELRVTYTVIHELDHHKEFGAQKQIRKRARERVVWLEDRQGDPPVRPGTTLALDLDTPPMDANGRLDPARPDHQIIASALALLRTVTEQRVVLVTDDGSLRMSAKTFGLKCIRPPETARLPESDEDQRRLRELQEENSRLKNRLPKLRLIFPDGSVNAEQRVKQRKVATETDMASALASLRSQHPPMRLPTPPTEASGAVERYEALMAMTAFASSGVPTKEQIERFNRTLEEFFRCHQVYLRDFAVWAERCNRILPVTLRLHNFGTCAGRHVAIDITLPAGISACDREKLPHRPMPPEAPRRPESLLDLIPHGGAYDPMGHDFLSRLTDSVSIPEVRPNVEGPLIRRVKEQPTVVRYLVDRAPHEHECKLRRFWIEFPPGDVVRSVKLDYSIHADELPESTTGAVHIRVSTVDGE